MDVSIKNNQKVEVSVSFEKLSGEVIAPELISEVVWSSSDENTLLVVAVDGAPLSAVASAVGPLGSASIVVNAVYEGSPIGGSALVEVTESGIFVAKFTFGTPVDQ